MHSEKYNLVASLSLSNDIIFGFGTSLTIRPFIDVRLVFQCNSQRDFNVRFVDFSDTDFEHKCPNILKFDALAKQNYKIYLRGFSTLNIGIKYTRLILLLISRPEMEFFKLKHCGTALSCATKCMQRCWSLNSSI